MLLLELFSGNAHVSQIAREQFGYNTITLDINPKCNPDICCDLLDWDYKAGDIKPDIIWASPDCTAFSIASGGHHFKTHKYRTHRYHLEPLTPTAETGLKLVAKTIEIIKHFNPVCFYIENPRGLMRQVPALKYAPIRRTVSYFDYGFDYYKATDVFTNNLAWYPRPAQHHHRIKGHRRFDTVNRYADRISIPPALIAEVFTSHAQLFASR